MSVTINTIQNGTPGTGTITPPAANQTASQSVLPIYTFANLPSASANPNLIANVSDVGLYGSEWQSDGTVWRLRFAVPIIATDTAANNVTGTAAETLFTGATVTLPANALANNKVRANVTATYTGSTNQKTVRLYVGGTVFGTISENAAANTVTRLLALVHNRGNTNAQNAESMTSNSSGTSAITNTAGTENIGVAVTVKVTGQLATSTETVTLAGALVELVPGA